MNRRRFLELGITAATAAALLPGCATVKRLSYAPRGKRGLGLGTKGNDQWREKLQLVRAH